MVMEWQREGVSQVAQVFIEPPQCLWPPLLQYLCVLVPFINVQPSRESSAFHLLQMLYKAQHWCFQLGGHCVTVSSSPPWEGCLH